MNDNKIVTANGVSIFFTFLNMPRTYLGKTSKDLKKCGGELTAREISGQPALWKRTWEYVAENREELESFLSNIDAESGLEIILTGAGTSAFIGETAEPVVRRYWSHPARAVATTTLVTHFDDYVDTAKPLLLVSFARSGNSPESTATIQIAESRCTANVYHLIITCNPNGNLAEMASDLESQLVLMPPEAEDKSLAMTGSFTAMLLAVLLISDLGQLDRHRRHVRQIAETATNFLNDNIEQVEKLAALDVDRAVFLGSGPRLGIAHEAHLKLQELTDGKVICKYDSFLGFRHGPKAVIDNRTLMVYHFSEDPYVVKYERDLVESIREKGFGMASFGIHTNQSRDISTDVSILMDSPENSCFEHDFLPVVSVLPAQVLGFFSSLKFGLQPDSPSSSGAISRVVEGVKIYT